MSRGLRQGTIGRGSFSLAPSVRALGPNIYLGRHDFLKMLGVALLLHVLAFVVTALLPDRQVRHIPVRALSFKIGGGERVIAHTAPVRAPAMQAVPAAAPVPAPVVPKPSPKPVEATVAPAAPPPALTRAPRQYVREVGAAPQAQPQPQSQPVVAPAGASVTNVQQQLLQAERVRYEQEISGWIQRHKYYPADAGGREGRVVVRMRIDRMGNVRYYAIEQSSGLTVLDAAALDMIRRANPVPAVPETYQAGNLVEFLIPISFKAPL